MVYVSPFLVTTTMPTPMFESPSSAVCTVAVPAPKASAPVFWSPNFSLNVSEPPPPVTVTFSR